MYQLLQLIAVAAVSLRPNEDGTWRYPVNEMGEACEFPFDPILRSRQPLGQYHCPYCGGMQIAGVPHIDWELTDEDLAAMAAMANDDAPSEDVPWPQDFADGV